MKHYPFYPAKVFTSLLVLLLSAASSFAQNKKTCIDSLLRNPEYKVLIPEINSMRSQGMTDKKIFDALDAEARQRRIQSLKNAKQAASRKHDPIVPLAGPCNNDDIGVETGTFGNWTAEIRCLSTVTVNCTPTNWAATPLPLANRIIVTPPPANDPCADVPGFPITNPSPFGGKYSIKLGNNDINAESERLSYTFTVQPSDINFVYQYAVVLEDPGHLPSEQPYFDFVITDSNGDTIPCSFKHYIAAPNTPGFHTSNLSNTPCNNISAPPPSTASPVYYTDWTTVGVNLGGYVGQPVTITCTTSDCSRCGHFAYTYLDFFCGSIATNQYCFGADTIQLTAPYDPTFTYLWSPGGQTTDTITIVNPHTSDTIRVHVTPPSGCGFDLQYVLMPTVINAGFSYTVNCNTVNFSDTSVIAGGTLTNWQWSFPGGSPSTSTSQNPTVTYPSPGTYSATMSVTSQAGCGDTSITVQITIAPPPNITATNTSICGGQTGTICAQGATSYSWIPTNQTTQCITVTTASPTTYTVIGTTGPGCTSTTTASVTITPGGAVTAGPSSTICMGRDTAHLLATGGTVYSWIPSTGLSCNNCPNPNANPGSSNTYTVYVTNSSGCSNTATVSVTVGAIPFVSAIAPTTICTGESATLLANVSNVPVSQQPVTWYWYPPNNLNNPTLQNPTASPVGTTTYVVTVTDAYGCKDDTSTVVYVQTIPTVTWAQWDPTFDCEGYVIPFKANVSSNGQSVYWSFGDGTNATTAPPNTNPDPHAYPYNGTYTISVAVQNKPCQTTLDTVIHIGDMTQYMNILEANVFTPNGDNFNDCFHPAITLQSVPANTTAEELQAKLSQCVELEVYDRWGIKMFESTDDVKCWDGKTKGGTPAKQGTYYYIARYKEVTLKGFVELLRDFGPNR